jgi:uracil phosphoribosyltransferase
MTATVTTTIGDKLRSTSFELDESIITASNIHVSKHPVLSHKISILRSSSTNPSSFRSTLREITFHLGYEATSTLSTKPVALTVPVGHDHVDCIGKKLADRVALVPILRSGLGMIDSMLELLPDAGVHHIGMYRKGTMPVQYYNRLPRKCESDVAYILDPMIATASTIMSVISILKKWGVPKIHVVSVVASETGIKAISKTHPDVEITVATVDKELTEDGILLPGLGDAGDRLFGTPMIDDDEALLHPSKRRKTSMDESSVN